SSARLRRPESRLTLPGYPGSRRTKISSGSIEDPRGTRGSAQLRRLQVQQPRRVRAEQLLFECPPEPQVQQRLNRGLQAVGNVRKIAAEHHPVLKFQDTLDRRWPAQVLVEHHRRVQKHAFVNRADVEKGFELV